MRAIKIFLGIIIGLIAGILGFIALGSVLASFSIPKPAEICLLYTSPSPRDLSTSRMPSSA